MPQVAHETGILLNRWLSALFLRRPLEEVLPLLPAFTSPLSEHEKAVLVNRILLTLMRYASPSMLQVWQERLMRWSLYIAALPENQLALAQLLWLMGDFSTAQKAIQKALNSIESVEDQPFPFVQTSLILLLIESEARDWTSLVRHLRSILYQLRKLKKIVASAFILSRFLRRLYEARLRPRVLRSVAEAWEKHLQNYPVERLFWETTLLSDWVQAHIRGMTLREYRSTLSYPPFTQVDSLLIQGETFLTPPL